MFNDIVPRMSNVKNIFIQKMSKKEKKCNKNNKNCNKNNEMQYLLKI